MTRGDDFGTKEALDLVKGQMIVDDGKVLRPGTIDDEYYLVFNLDAVLLAARSKVIASADDSFDCGTLAWITGRHHSKHTVSTPPLELTKRKFQLATGADREGSLLVCPHRRHKLHRRLDWRDLRARYVRLFGLPRTNPGYPTSNRHQAPSTKQQATSNKQQATSNKQQATSNKQQATSNKQQATSNKQSNIGQAAYLLTLL